MQRLLLVAQTFTPSMPISRKDLFSGRVDEILEVATALASPGQHVALYGERGTGKTSLANVIAELMAPSSDAVIPACRVNCDTEDKFLTIWRRAFQEADIEWPAEWTQYEPPRPDDIRRVVANHAPFYLIIDEFDRIEDDDSVTLFADTIKSFSDHGLSTKLLIVGVASSMDQLMGEHASIQRALHEVLMPRMSDEDMRQIIATGAKELDIAFDEGAIESITRLAEGLPHFVHLLAGEAAKACIQDDRETVGVKDVRVAAEKATQTHSLLREYQTAVQSGRENLFAEVLTACALSHKNELGQFTPKAVEKPLSEIMRKKYDIPGFARHLNKFTGIDRGSVLEQEGIQRRYTYRFRNPLLQPFTILMAIRQGLLPPGYLKEVIDDPHDPEPELPFG